MPRKALIGVCSLAALALFAVIAPGAQAARTWAGTWSSGVGGEMVLDATGSGTYSSGRGTIRGGVNGDVNQGTWDSNNNSTGTFKFTLDPNGLTFLGEGRYDDTGISGNAFAWNGTCIAGACLNNTANSCPARSGTPRLLVPFRLDDDEVPECGKPWILQFGFTIAELPGKPGPGELENGLVDVQFTGVVELSSQDKETGYEGDGKLEMFTRVRAPGEKSGGSRPFGCSRGCGKVDFKIDGPATYSSTEGGGQKEGTAKRVVKFRATIESSSDQSCPTGGTVKFAFGVRQKEKAREAEKAALTFKGDCLSSEAVKWGPTAIKTAYIDKPGHK
jgi:hypothetical protein